MLLSQKEKELHRNIALEGIEPQSACQQLLICSESCEGISLFFSVLKLGQAVKRNEKNSAKHTFTIMLISI